MIPENTRDWQSVKRIAGDCREWSRAFVVMGSLVLMPGEKTAKSDVDVLVLVDSLAPSLKHIPGLSEAARKDAYSLLKHHEIDAVSTKKICYGTLVSFSVFDVRTFMRIAELALGEISYYRTTSNQKRIEIRSFDGSSLMSELLPVQSGTGYIVSEPCVVLANSRTYLGIFPDAILSLVHVCYDDGSFSTFYDRIWSAVAAVASEAMGSRDIEVLVKGLIATKINRERFSQEVVVHIRKRLAEVMNT
jgi:predicted nucleotidyltransferase